MLPPAPNPSLKWEVFEPELHSGEVTGGELLGCARPKGSQSQSFSSLNPEDTVAMSIPTAQPWVSLGSEQ